MTGSVTCTQCDAGYRCPYAHLSPIVCIRGTYSEAGWTSCQACVAGEYADSVGRLLKLFPIQMSEIKMY